MTNPILMCPPVKLHETAPEDQPGCVKIPCPYCDEPCWISAKKRAIKTAIDEAIVACYICIMKAAKKSPGTFKGMEKRDI